MTASISGPKWCATAFIVTALLQTASATVGENESQIEARYGKPFNDIGTETFGLVRGFMSDRYVIGVKFIDGNSQMEMFSRKDQADLPASEIDHLLKETGAADWKAEQTNNPRWRRWRRSDNAAVALYDAIRHFLYVSSSKFFNDQLHKLESATPPPVETPAS